MYSHPRAIDSQRRLFGRRRRPFGFWFWTLYGVFLASSAVAAGAFYILR